MDVSAFIADLSNRPECYTETWGVLGEFSVRTIYAYYDAPIIYVMENTAGDRYLAYDLGVAQDDSGQPARWCLFPFSIEAQWQAETRQIPLNHWLSTSPVLYVEIYQNPEYSQVVVNPLDNTATLPVLWPTESVWLSPLVAACENSNSQSQECL